MELTRLTVLDVDFAGGAEFERQGKGRKDRVGPIGERTLAWIEKYLADTRPELARAGDAVGSLFVTEPCARLTVRYLPALVTRWVAKAGLGKLGSCHLFRHAWPTLILEHGADIRPVVITALAVRADWLLTLDEGDFHTKHGREVYGLCLATPGEFLLEQRALETGAGRPSVLGLPLAPSKEIRKLGGPMNAELPSLPTRPRRVAGRRFEGTGELKLPGAGAAAFVVDPNSGLPGVLSRTKNGTTTYYVYGLGLLYEVTGSSSNQYLFDHIGNTVAMVNDSQAVTDRWTYSSFGVVVAHSGSTDTPFQFNGEWGVQTDPNGLDYMRSRYYNPRLMRFLNADPSKFGGGENWFAYCGDDPISNVDPLGLWTAAIGVQASGGGGAGGGISGGIYIGHQAGAGFFSGWSAAVLGTGGLGPFLGLGYTKAGAFLQFTNAGNVSDLKGKGLIEL